MDDKVLCINIPPEELQQQQVCTKVFRKDDQFLKVNKTIGYVDFTLFVDINEVIRSYKNQKNGQYNRQSKNNKTNNGTSSTSQKTLNNTKSIANRVQRANNKFMNSNKAMVNCIVYCKIIWGLHMSNQKPQVF